MQQSVRKHYTQMTEEESLFLFQEAFKVNKWDIHGHLFKQAKERGLIDKEELIDVLRFGDLIEFHLKNGRARILVRGTRAYAGYVPCVVFEIKTGKIITLYWNNVNDDHRTIDMSRYNQDLEVYEKYETAA